MKIPAALAASAALALSACDGTSISIGDFPTLTVHGTITAGGAPVIGAIVVVSHYLAADCSGITTDVGHSSTGPAGTYEALVTPGTDRVTGCLKLEVSSTEFGNLTEVRAPVAIPLDGDDTRYELSASY
jgi:hypothetical protein